MKKIFLLLAAVSLSGCNFWEPFDGKKSTNDLLELATKCLDDGDFACAINNYNSLPEGSLKEQKLCTAYLAKSGLTIDTLINVVSEKDPSMLGRLAQALTPWNATQQSDAGSAVTACAAFATYNPNDGTAALLKSMSDLSHCGVLIAKTDQYLGAFTGDTACTTPGNDDGKITQGDINQAGGTAPFMCDADVIQCQNDLAAIDPTTLGILSQAGLTDIQSAIGLIPSDIRTSGAGIAAGRAAIVTTLPPS